MPKGGAETGVLRRAHPFTVVTLVAAASVAAFTLPPPGGPAWLALGLAGLAVLAGEGRVLGPALVLAVPFWGFALVLHGVLGGDPGRAVTLASRISALLVAFLTLLRAVHPARLVEALLASGWPFWIAYLLSATLQAVPRLRQRAAAILAAQRCRGLRVRGSLVRRARAVVPLAVPLVLAALAEVNERALALEARGAGASARRTVLHPPANRGAERTLRWSLVVGMLALLVWRILR